MKRIIYTGLLAHILALTLSYTATAATLGLTTQDPSLNSSNVIIDYFEFSTDGDLSSFGGLIDSTSGISPFGLTEFSFGIGFSLTDPTHGATGGFDIFDENGLLIGGDLTAVGFSDSVIEFQFDHLIGSAAANFGSSALMLVNFFDQLGPNPFSALSDGGFYSASVTISSVTTVQEPGILAIIVLAIVLMSFTRSRNY